MKDTIHAFYVPGLGDSRSKSQDNILKLWNIYGIKVDYHPMYWSDNRSFSNKFKTFLEAIDSQTDQSGKVALIGTSAGASAVINAFAARRNQINRVVCICGKINNPHTISNRFYENPSYEESLDLLGNSLASLNEVERSHILSLHPICDGVVPVTDTLIDGAQKETMPIVGHSASIAYALTIGSHRIANFLKS